MVCNVYVVDVIYKNNNNVLLEMNDKYSLSFLFQGCIVGQKWKKYCNFILFNSKKRTRQPKIFFLNKCHI